MPLAARSGTKANCPVRVVDHLLFCAGLQPSVAAEVLRLMGSSGRHYHGLSHLGALWSRHRKYAPAAGFAGAGPSRLVACAIAFHDAVYEPLRDDNETRSAALWREAAPRDMAPGEVEWVAATIEATANHLAVADAGNEPARLRLWVLDLDLTPLGERPALFDRHTGQLRREFAALDDAEWRRRRCAFLRQVAAAPRIYRSPPLQAVFERQARENVARALRLGA